MNIRDRIHRYERAEITIVALHEKKTKKNYNIYSLVELCPLAQSKQWSENMIFTDLVYEP